VTVSIAALLLVTSWMQTFLPGRSGEITDTLMILIVALIFTLMPPEYDAAEGSVPVATAETPDRGNPPHDQGSTMGGDAIDGLKSD
jgi:hypothetical protein